MSSCLQLMSINCSRWSFFFSVLPCLQEGGLVKVEVVIGIPQRGPYHLALRQANPGTLFTGGI